VLAAAVAEGDFKIEGDFYWFLLFEENQHICPVNWPQAARISLPRLARMIVV
jgi:hypothetical protein